MNSPYYGAACWLCCIIIHRKDDLALGLQIALVISVVVTTFVFTVVACSDPGVVYESYEAPTTAASIQVGDAELGPGVICGAFLFGSIILIFVMLFGD